MQGNQISTELISSDTLTKILRESLIEFGQKMD